jgi:hypothetical protein
MTSVTLIDLRDLAYEYVGTLGQTSDEWLCSQRRLAELVLFGDEGEGFLSWLERRHSTGDGHGRVRPDNMAHREKPEGNDESR